MDLSVCANIRSPTHLIHPLLGVFCKRVTPTQFLRLCFLLIVCLIRKWVSIYRESRAQSCGDETFSNCAIRICGGLHFSCVGAAGLIFLLLFTESPLPPTNISSRTKGNPVAGNFLGNKGCKARHSQIIHLNRETCIHSSLDVWERARVSQTGSLSRLRNGVSQSLIDKLRGICLCWVESCRKS